MNVFRTSAVVIPLLATLSAAISACTGSTPAASSHSPTAAPPTATGTGSAPAAAPGASCPAGAVTVSSADSLRSALSGAHPGETIVLAPGLYQGDFVVSQSGTASSPITLCGPRTAVLEGSSISKGYTLHLDHASWWRIEGFTVQGGQKGIMTDASSYNLLYGLYVHSTGDEAIHLRDFSTHNTVSHCEVRNTGLLVQFFGEGIYVGTAHKNWCRYSGCQPDASDNNIVEYNNVADTTAENIDIKEGTTGGQITGNQLDGTGMVASASTAWVNVKGNDWQILNNSGANSVKDGFQVHQVYPGWGIGNVFRGNHAVVNGPGYGIYVQHKRLQTVVACDNQVTAAGRGLSTIDCTS
jgi:Right handed beta helix region